MDKKYIQVLFYLLVFLHALPVLLLDHLISVDGPAHLYNANLIIRLLSAGNDSANIFFEFSNSWSPNWTAHILLVLLSKLFGAFAAEKWIWFLYLVLLPMSFKSLIQTISPKSNAAPFYVFPFIYAFPLFLGFYSFCLALPIVFYLLAFVLRDNKIKQKRLYLFFLLGLLYFSHVFAFFAFWIALFVHFFFSILTVYEDKFRVRQKVKILLYLSVPFFLLFIYFAVNAGISGIGGDVSFREKYIWLRELRVIQSLDYNFQLPFTKALFYILFFVPILLVSRKSSQFFERMPWLTLSFVFCILFFVFPNHAVSGGFISIRLFWLCILFYVIWLGSLNTQAYLSWILALIFSGISLLLLQNNFRKLKEQSDLVSELLEANLYISPASILLPINYSEDLMHTNISSYLALKNKVVLLDNYEASQKHFHLEWKKNRSPYESAGTFSTNKNPCLTLLNFEKTANVKVDYISVWNKPKALNDSCGEDLRKQLDAFFNKTMVSSGGHLVLYKRK